MNRKSLFAILLTFVMLGSVFAGGALASTNAQFDGESVDEIDATGTFYVNAPDPGVENVTVSMDEDVSLTADETVTYNVGPYPSSAEVAASSGDGEVEATINADGDIEVTETTGADPATLEELHVTVDVNQINYVGSSGDAVNMDEEFSGTEMVSFEAQQSDGERLNVEASVTEDFFVVVHEVDDEGEPITEDDDENMTHIGVSEEMDAGEYHQITMVLDESIEDTQDLNVMVHESDDGEVGNAIQDLDATSEVTVEDEVMSEVAPMIEAPAGTEEVHDYGVYNVNSMFDISIDIDQDEYEIGEEVDHNISLDRNTNYDFVSVSATEFEIKFDDLSFDDIEDETDADNLVRTDIEDTDNSTIYHFEVDDSTLTDEEYTVEFLATPNAVDEESALVASAEINPEGGVVSDTSEDRSVELAGAGLGFGDLPAGGMGVGAGALLIIALGGALIYKGKDPDGRLSFGGYGATMSSDTGLSIVWALAGIAGISMLIEVILLSFGVDFQLWTGIEQVSLLVALGLGSVLWIGSGWLGYSRYEDLME